MRVSNNPDYRPSDPPQVGSQQFGSGAGASPSPYGSGQAGYGSGQAGYGSGQAGYGQSGYGDPSQAGYGGGQYTDYGQYLDSVGPSGGQPYSVQPASYSQPVTYGTYGTPTVVYRKSNGLAGWAMWMGIIGLAGGFVCGLLSMIPFIGWFFSFILMFLWIAPFLAVIFGHVSLGQIKRSGEDGRGQAMAGLIMGYISIGLGLLAIIVAAVVGVGILALLSTTS
ncbi:MULTISPECIES: DUF4190 domain-containing protein [Brevibacterium]|uniref:DUF4190 domain-containing protein n=1 Tax=Brevibacterium casei TaxID=33889 RepID=A0A449D8U4_9MICO|nr:DUF4190 domain-containing protein [Brevibacterium casei]MCT1446868.1 DUF4190 domain-containing protein [Brevibacterium casei]VEW13966.1 Uncharacterised protein [Brevibacterium casei]